MNRRHASVLALLSVCIAARSGFAQSTLPSTRPAPKEPPKVYNVKDFGAKADGVTKDTAAFQKALDTCAVNGGGDVLVPGGRYLIGSIQMGTRTIIRLEKETVITGSGDAADYPDMSIRWEGRWQNGRRGLIWANSVDHIGIIGPGTINGNPQMAAPQNPRGSVVLEPISCTDVVWQDFSVTQGGNWATHPTYCTDLFVKNVSIRGNRDGIDVDSCKNVRIDSCTITTGDDSISLKSGRGMDGARLGKPTEQVTITNCTLTDSTFACLGLGSEISAGIRDIQIDHCKLSSPRSPAIYLKSRVGRAGVTENIVADELDVLAGGLLKINLVNGGNTNTNDDPVEGAIGIPSAKNLKFSNIRLTNATTIADVGQVNPEKPIEGLSFINITGTAQKGLTLNNIKDANLKDLKVTGFQGALLMTNNVTGMGLDGATPYTPAPPAPARGGPGRGGIRGGPVGVPVTPLTPVAPTPPATGR